MKVRRTAVRWSLAPLGALYGSVAWLRRQTYAAGLRRQARLAGPVISVGNLSVGGSGKTPLVAAIAGLLRDRGHPVAVLSRGYRGAFDGDALIVSDGQTILADAALAGDEPVMLARDLPGVVVAVGRRRDRVGVAVEARFGRRVHVLDDGFQHLRLARDLDLLCVTPADLEDWPLPAGRLREPASAWRRAQAFFVSSEGECAPAVLARLAGRRVFRLGRQVIGLFDREGRPQAAPLKPFAFCGIARPERFLADLQGQVAQRAGQMLFRDHHAYSAAELDSLTRYALARGADALVTTSKDAARLGSWQGALPLHVLRISASIEPREEFERLLLDAAHGRARA